MPDSPIPRGPAPSSWSDAFATLPSEAPPAGAWAAVARRVPVAPHAPRPMRRHAFAFAAAVAVVAAVLIAVRVEPRPEPARSARTAGLARTSVGPAGVLVPPSDTRTPARAQGAVGQVPETVGQSVAAVDPRPTPAVRTPHRAPTARRAPVVAVQNHGVARSASGTAIPVAGTPDPSPSHAPAADSIALDELRSESARLEALATLARSDGMASGPAVVLAAEAEDRVRLIDAALSRPGLSEAERFDLWTRRVDALRELAGVEGTTRWLAAQGEAFQGAIALVD